MSGGGGHFCHADGCTVLVAPRFLMCPRHWRMVPPDIQRAIWSAYVPGQEIRKNPTAEYMAAFEMAVNAVATAENRPLPFHEAPNA